MKYYRIVFDEIPSSCSGYLKIQVQCRFLGFIWWKTIATNVSESQAETWIDRMKQNTFFEGKL